MTGCGSTTRSAPWRTTDPLGAVTERLMTPISVSSPPMTRRGGSSQTDPDGLAVEHELVFDRRGLLTSRTRGSQGMSWEYDGNRTEFTDSLNSTT